MPVADATRPAPVAQTFRWREAGPVYFVIIPVPTCFTRFLVEGNLLLRDVYALTSSRHIGTFHSKLDVFDCVLWLADYAVSYPRFQLACPCPQKLPVPPCNQRKIRLVSMLNTQHVGRG